MMNQQMFCFQCEQTAGCTGCTEKPESAENPQIWHGCRDELTGALVGLARAIEGTGGSGRGGLAAYGRGAVCNSYKCEF